MRYEDSSFLYKVIYKVLDFFYPKTEIIGLENVPEEGAVFVGNHSQAHGPLISVIRLPFEHYTWCVSKMMIKEEVADYAFQDFWSGKPRSVRWLFRLFSKMLPLLAVFLFNSAPTIPVYRDVHCIDTFRMTMQKLQEGAHIVLYPEHYTPYNNIVWEFEDGFIDIARLYYKKTGKCLEFVPMYLAPKLKKVFICKPIRFNPETPYGEEKHRICTELMDSITEIAVAQPLHTVIPYPNVSKKKYPNNKTNEVNRHA